MKRTNKSALRSALLLCASAVMAISTHVSVAAEIFTDNFNVADTNSLDGSDQTGRHTGLVANDVVLRSGGIQMEIAGNQLTFKNRESFETFPRTGNIRFQPVALPENTHYDFAAGASGTAMLGAGGFRFEFDWTPDNNSSGNWIALSAGYTEFEVDLRVNDLTTDFAVLFRNSGGSQFFDNGEGTDGDSFDVSDGPVQRRVRVDFTFSSFADGSAVTARAYVDGVLLGSRNFTWDDNGGVLYLELANIDSVKQLDNVSITTLPAAGGNYQTWATDNGVTGTATDDDDTDGVANLIEYIADTKPTIPSANPVVSGTTTISSNTFLTLSYPRRAGDTNIQYVVKGSTNLTGAFGSTTGSTNTVGNVSTYTDDVPLNPTNSRRFLRLEVTNTNP